MTKVVATRISDEDYSKLMKTCAGLGCSVYDYLKMLLEIDVKEVKETKQTEEKQRSDDSSQLDEMLERLKQKLEAAGL